IKPGIAAFTAEGGAGIVSWAFQVAATARVTTAMSEVVVEEHGGSLLPARCRRPHERIGCFGLGCEQPKRSVITVKAFPSTFAAAQEKTDATLAVVYGEHRGPRIGGAHAARLICTVRLCSCPPWCSCSAANSASQPRRLCSSSAI